ncbi:MAG: hypothetical protein HQK53_07520, partial [Oligoflexia bacterium]|nr:hypothetical protein [Oligoflexia bacterium]
LNTPIDGENFVVGSSYAQADLTPPPGGLDYAQAPGVLRGLLTAAQAEAIMAEVAFGNPNIEVTNIPNPDFDLRTFPENQKLYVEQLKSIIYSKINGLASNQVRGYYLNPDHVRGKQAVRFNPDVGAAADYPQGGHNYAINPVLGLAAATDPLSVGLGPTIDSRTDSLNIRAYLEPAIRSALYLRLNDNHYDRLQYIKLMKSISFKAHTMFIESMVDLSTSFVSYLEGSRDGFIHNFTLLFVSKQFESKGRFGDYAHFTLRCGQVH